MRAVPVENLAGSDVVVEELNHDTTQFVDPEKEPRRSTTGLQERPLSQLLVPRSSANAASYRSEAMAIQSSMSSSSSSRPSTSS